MFEKVEFSFTNTTDFLNNLESLARTLAARATPNTTLIVKLYYQRSELLKQVCSKRT
jgi:hypothetical protein